MESTPTELRDGDDTEGVVLGSKVSGERLDLGR